MIIEFFIGLGLDVANWIGTLFEPIEIPAWATDALNGIAGFLTSIAGLGAWTPWAAIGAAVGLTLAVFGVMFGAKLVRAVASYLPFIGGAG